MDVDREQPDTLPEHLSISSVQKKTQLGLSDPPVSRVEISPGLVPSPDSCRRRRSMALLLKTASDRGVLRYFEARAEQRLQTPASLSERERSCDFPRPLRRKRGRATAGTPHCSGPA